MTELNNTQLLKPFKILLVGDSCVDEYFYGSVDRLSPEAPVPILKINHGRKEDGMAANVYNNLLAFGCDVDFITGTVKSIKTRYIDERSKQHIIRVDQDTLAEPFKLSQVQDYSIYDAIVISDYSKGFINASNISEVCATFNGHILIDTKIDNLGWLDMYRNAYVKINKLDAFRFYDEIWLIGKYKGTSLKNTPKQYIEWAYNNMRLTETSISILKNYLNI